MMPFILACPKCGSLLDCPNPDEYRCPRDQSSYLKKDGIWRFLPQERAVIYKAFIQDYEEIRRQEGRGSPDRAYYQTLPFHDLTGRFQGDWRIRSISFRTLNDILIRPLHNQLQRGLTILDLGAGNCWLSNRLSLSGHSVAAIDILDNPMDGLGAHMYYDSNFIPIQAEIDHLPLANQQVDLIIYNGSFHYSTDYQTTLYEALRVLKSDGSIAIIDTPIYQRESSGEQMVLEREQSFQCQYGFPSNALPFENYLTYDRLNKLSLGLNIQWKLHTPNYGLRWALRPMRAKLRGHREPAKFKLIVGKPTGRDSDS